MAVKSTQGISPEGRASRWLAVFGPGAIIASLTIGSGELVFSSRGGALFGYHIMSVFLMVCVLKWALVFATARHLVLTGAHPFQRWMELPGPRGWLPIVFLLLAIPAFPIFVSFHSGTVGTLLAALMGGSYLGWGIAILVIVGALTLLGGYKFLETIQLWVVALMLVATVLALFFIQPDWLSMVQGMWNLPSSAYPDWAANDPEIATRAVWVELTTYVGVVGGSGYDYLAYCAFLREKHWGNASLCETTSDSTELDVAKGWVRAPLVDSAISFLVVFVFSAVFVACGAEILATHQQVPKGNNLLTLQAEFVGVVSPWLKPLYYAGAILAMAGTLYGTINVAPAILRELARALQIGRYREAHAWHRPSVWWVCLGSLGILVYKLVVSQEGQPPGLVAMLTPVNLFTGVFACGIICLLSVWADHRFLQKSWRPSVIVTSINLVGCAVFLFLGFKAYWDHSGWSAFLIFAGTISAGWATALWLRGKSSQ